MNNGEIVQALAQRFVERAAALKYTGKKRDNAALDFFCGAAALAEESGNLALASQLGANAVLIVSIRGYIGVKEIAEGK